MFAGGRHGGEVESQSSGRDKKKNLPSVKLFEFSNQAWCKADCFSPSDSVGRGEQKEGTNVRRREKKKQENQSGEPPLAAANTYLDLPRAST